MTAVAERQQAPWQGGVWWTVRRYARMTGIYVYQHVLHALSWRGFMLTLVFQQFITPLLGLAVWSAALPGNASVSTYYVALLVVQLVTVCYEGNTFANELTSGELGKHMLRPYPVILRVVAANLAWRIWHVLFGTPAVVVIALLAGVTFATGPLLAALPALAIAAALRFVFTYAVVLTALWTQQSGSILGFANTLIFLLGGIAAPVTLFPGRYRWLGEALPFRGMAGFPAEIATGALSGQEIAGGYGRPVTFLLTYVVPVAFIASAPALALTRGPSPPLVLGATLAAAGSIALARLVCGNGLRRYTSATS